MSGSSFLVGLIAEFDAGYDFSERKRTAFQRCLTAGFGALRCQGQHLLKLFGREHHIGGKDAFIAVESVGADVVPVNTLRGVEADVCGLGDLLEGRERRP